MRSSNSKDRRAYRRFTPLFFMLLEMTGVLELLFIGYLIFGDNDIYKAISATIFIALFLVSYTKMSHVYHRSWYYLKTHRTWLIH